MIHHNQSKDHQVSMLRQVLFLCLPSVLFLVLEICQRVLPYEKSGIKVQPHIPDNKTPQEKYQIGKEHQFANGVLLICTQAMGRNYFLALRS